MGGQWGQSGGFKDNEQQLALEGGHHGTEAAKLGLLMETGHGNLPLHLTERFP